MQAASNVAAHETMTGALIDCDVHNVVPHVEALFPYLPPYWVEHVQQSAFKGATTNYYPPNVSVSARGDSKPLEAPAGSSLALLREQVLDPLDIEVAILNCLYAIDSLHNPEAAVAFASAINDWQIAVVHDSLDDYTLQQVRRCRAGEQPAPAAAARSRSRRRGRGCRAATRRG